jgi:hypothetical protein
VKYRRCTRLLVLAALLTCTAGAAQQGSLPTKPDSLKFAVICDNGTGKKPQFEVAAQMEMAYRTFPFELVIMLGDNIYGGQSPKDLVDKFERPYKPLLDAGVKFYASLGNHDDRAQARYALFNMEGKTYYTFKAPKEDVRFFALETDYLRPQQIAWFEQEMAKAGEKWIIPYFHHPLYSSGGRHGGQADIAMVLEPIFLKYNVSVVFAGHDHFYERIKPQKGIVHFVTGSGGKLRKGDINRRSGLTAVGFDTDQVFLAAEIKDDRFYFNAISRTGAIIDSGAIERRKPE